MDLLQIAEHPLDRQLVRFIRERLHEEVEHGARGHPSIHHFFPEHDQRAATRDFVRRQGLER